MNVKYKLLDFFGDEILRPPIDEAIPVHVVSVEFDAASDMTITFQQTSSDHFWEE